MDSVYLCTVCSLSLALFKDEFFKYFKECKWYVYNYWECVCVCVYTYTHIYTYIWICYYRHSEMTCSQIHNSYLHFYDFVIGLLLGKQYLWSAWALWFSNNSSSSCKGTFENLVIFIATYFRILSYSTLYISILCLKN